MSVSKKPFLVISIHNIDVCKIRKEYASVSIIKIISGVQSWGNIIWSIGHPYIQSGHIAWSGNVAISGNAFPDQEILALHICWIRQPLSKVLVGHIILLWVWAFLLDIWWTVNIQQIFRGFFNIYRGVCTLINTIS